MSTPNQKTFKKKDWSLVKYQDEPEQTGREINRVAIGYITKPNGENEYVIEKIFKDILEEVYQTESDYTTAIDINCVPKVVIFYNGNLVIHNPEIGIMVDEIKEALMQIDVDLRYQTYTDMRKNMECISKYSTSTQFLITQVNAITGKKYSSILIRSVLNSLINEAVNKVYSPIEDVIRDFSYEELLEASCGVAQFKETGKCTIDPVLTIVNKMRCPFQEVEARVQQEIMFRLINGQLKR